MSKANRDLIIQKARWFMLVLLSAILFCAVIAFGLLWSYSPGKPKPFLEANGKPLNGSISEKSFVEINHSHQGMFIKGKDGANPTNSSAYIELPLAVNNSITLIILIPIPLPSFPKFPIFAALF